MYYVNAYYDVVDELITIFNFLKLALSSMIYIINDVIMCSDIMHSPGVFFNIIFIYLATILDIN